MKTSRLYKCLVTLIMVVFCVFGAYGVPSTRYEGTSTNNHLHLGLEWQSMKGLYGYYNNARFRDALLAGTFFQQDPLAEKYYPYTPYHYGAINPNKYTDKTGEALDLVWDLGNVIYDIYQAVSNHIKGDHQEAQGYWKDAAFDIGAAIIPGVPAGATKVFKYTDNAIDISKNTKRIVSNTVETNTSKNARFIGDSDGKIIDIQSTPKGSYIQPNGDRTDILQNKSHYKKVGNGQMENHGTTHTHKAKQNIDKNGVKHKYVDRNDTHIPTNEEILNIQTGKAIRK